MRSDCTVLGEDQSRVPILETLIPLYRRVARGKSFPPDFMHQLMCRAIVLSWRAHGDRSATACGTGLGWRADFGADAFVQNRIWLSDFTVVTSEDFPENSVAIDWPDPGFGEGSSDVGRIDSLIPNLSKDGIEVRFRHGYPCFIHDCGPSVSSCISRG